MYINGSKNNNDLILSSKSLAYKYGYSSSTCQLGLIASRFVSYANKKWMVIISSFACFLKEKYPVTIQTHTKQIILNSFNLVFKDYWFHNQIHIGFGTALVCNKILKIINSIPTDKNISPLISYYTINLKQKWYKKISVSSFCQINTFPLKFSKLKKLNQDFWIYFLFLTHTGCPRKKYF